MDFDPKTNSIAQAAATAAAQHALNTGGSQDEANTAAMFAYRQAQFEEEWQSTGIPFLLTLFVGLLYGVYKLFQWLFRALKTERKREPVQQEIHKPNWLVKYDYFTREKQFPTWLAFLFLIIFFGSMVLLSKLVH